MKAMLVAAILLFPACPVVLAQLIQDEFETVSGTGRGADRADALRRAKEDALESKIDEMYRKEKLASLKETHLGMDDLLRSTDDYIGRVDVSSEKWETANLKDRTGASTKTRVCEIKVTANVNVSKLRRDFEKARRIAALRRFGEAIGVVLEERIRDPNDKDKSEPVHDDLSSIGAERLLMSYKFKPVPPANIRPAFHEEVRRGRTLSEAAFKDEIVEALAKAGAHVRIVGVVDVEEADQETDLKGRKLFVCVAGWWAELHVGDEYHRKLGSESKVAKGCKGMGLTAEEAREDAFKKAGEAAAMDLAVKLAEKLEEAEPVPTWEVMVVFNGIQPFQLRPLEAALNKIEGVTGTRKLRFGSGCYVVMVTAEKDRKLVEKDMEDAVREAGFDLEESKEDLIKFRGRN